MKPTHDWTEVHLLRPDLRYRSRTRREVMGYLRSIKLKMMDDWVYAGYRSIKGQGKRHIFRLRDPRNAMLLKLVFS